MLLLPLMFSKRGIVITPVVQVVQVVPVVILDPLQAVNNLCNQLLAE